MINNEQLFFVYGTLKREYWNNYLFDNGTYLGKFVTEPKYTLFNGPFPVVERGGETSIFGEVFRLRDEDEIQAIFDLERCSSRKQGDPNNWYDFDTINTDWGEAVIFVMDKGTSGRETILKNGKWV